MWQRNLGTARLQEPVQNFWLFTKSVRVDDYDIELAVGFLTNEKNKLAPARYNAFCFFPTKEKTGLNFIIHAPFLLTDSREGIRANSAFNRALIQKLAELAAESLSALKNFSLIDDGILEIIPCDPNAFTDPDSTDQISFRPFFDEIKKVMQTEAILPTGVPKRYVASQNAYWATTAKLSQLFGNEQLRMLTGNPNAAWVFTSVSERHVGGVEFNRYVKALVVESFNDESLLPLLNGDFIEQQKINWLRDLYSYLIEREERIKRTRALPIFLDQNRKAAAAFDAKGQASLFLPSKILTDYQTVYRELLKDKEITSCLERFGIKEPSLKDDIYKKILPRYQTEEAFETRSDIRTFVGYYQTASLEERMRLVNELKKYQFLYARSADGTPYRCYPHEIYIDSDDLRLYFEGVEEVYFVRSEDYAEYFKSKREIDMLKNFLREVGVADEVPRIIDHRFDEYRHENRIDGCQAVLQSIAATRDRNKSILLWRLLSKMFGLRMIDHITPRKTLCLEMITSARRPSKSDSTDIKSLRQTPWLIDINGQFKAPATLDSSTLSKEYDRKSEGAERLIKFLKIGDVSKLTPEQLRKIHLAEAIEQNFSDDEIKQLISHKQKVSTSNENVRADSSTVSNASTVRPRRCPRRS